MEDLYIKVTDFMFAFPIIIPVVVYVVPILILLSLSKKWCYLITSILIGSVIFIISFVDRWSIGFAGLTLYAFVHWSVILCIGIAIKNIYSKYKKIKN